MVKKLLAFVVGVFVVLYALTVWDDHRALAEQLRQEQAAAKVKYERTLANAKQRFIEWSKGLHCSGGPYNNGLGGGIIDYLREAGQGSIGEDGRGTVQEFVRIARFDADNHRDIETRSNAAKAAYFLEAGLSGGVEYERLVTEEGKESRRRFGFVVDNAVQEVIRDPRGELAKSLRTKGVNILRPSTEKISFVITKDYTVEMVAEEIMKLGKQWCDDCIEDKNLATDGGRRTP